MDSKFINISDDIYKDREKIAKEKLNDPNARPQTGGNIIKSDTIAE